jgi:PAS domain S-box-containing protein
MVATFGNGINGQIILAFPLVILLTALLLKPRAAFVSAGFLSGALLFLVWMQQIGFIQPSLNEGVTFTDFLVLSAILFIVAGLIFLVMSLSEFHLENVLEVEARRQENVLNSVIDAVIEIDSDGKVTAWNPSAEETFGWKREEALGIDLESLIIPPVHHAAHKAGMEHYLATGEGPVLNKRLELTALHKDRTELPIELQVTPNTRSGVQFFTAFIRDLTEYKRAAKAQEELLGELRAAEQRYAVIVDSAPNGILLVNSAGTITFTNPEGARLFGWQKEELLGQPVHSLLPDRLQSEHQQLVSSFFENPTKRAMGAGRDLFGKRADGTEFPLEIGLSPVETTEGIQVEATIIDVSVRKSYEMRESILTEIKEQVGIAKGIDEALKSCLKIVCEEFDWPVGHVYLKDAQDDELLIPSEIWHLTSSKSFSNFTDITMQTKFRIGEGLPGRVLSTEEYAWIPDINVDKNFPRNRSANDLNLVSAFAFPIKAYGRIFAILEFFMDKRVQFDENLQDVLNSLADSLDTHFELKFRQQEKESLLEQATSAQERFLSIIEGSPSGILLVDKDGKVQLTNKEAQNLFGYEAVDLQGISVSLLIPDRFRDIHPKHVSNFFESPSSRRMGSGRELFGRRADGSEFPLEIGLNPVYTDQGLQVVATVIDVSAQVEAQTALQKQSLLLSELRDIQAFFLGEPLGFKVFDRLLELLLRHTESEYGFIGEVLKDESGQEYLKTHAITDIAWDHATRKFYDEHAATGMEFYNLETLFGAVITGRTHVISNTPGQDPRSGGLPDGHPPLNSFLGIPVMVGDNLVGMVGIANRAAGYNESVIQEIEPLTRTYQTFIVSRRSELTRLSAEAELKALNKDLDNRILAATRELNEKNRSLQEFVYMASHDLQEPMRKLGSFAGMLNSKETLDEEEQAYALKAIETGAQRAQQMIRDLLSYSRADNQSLNVTSFDLRELVEEIKEDLQELIGQYKAQVDTFGDNPIFADRSLMKHVFQNLIQNAVVYSRPEEIPKIKIVAESKCDGFMCILVSDNGIGIAEKDLELVFRPFKRLDKKTPGTGIGLAICSRIIERHGSKISVDSKPGRGTSFYFELNSDAIKDKLKNE